MKTLKRFSAVLVLLSLFCLTALAGETQSAPCTDPEQTSTPPCAAPGETSCPPGEEHSVIDTANPGETHSPPLAEVIDAGFAVALELTLFW
jgi:hypothetical protein